MRFGVRECANVVLRAKARQKVGNKIFYKGEPVCYFDSLRTSTLEGAATTVYATGGRGNTRLMSWDGERTITFTMEDALISPEGLMILSGAGMIEATEDKPIYQHVTEQIDANDTTKIKARELGAGYKIILSEKAYLPDDMGDNFAYVMLMRNGELISEPYIPTHTDAAASDDPNTIYISDSHRCYDASHAGEDIKYETDIDTMVAGIDFDAVLIDYYVARTSGAKQIEITPDQFGGNYYLEAETLFRDENGVDMPAEFIIPNCKIQSNFSFTMAGSGDPSSFTFTMDAFPDYTRFDKAKKVLAAIQIIEVAGAQEYHRGFTNNGLTSREAGDAAMRHVHERLRGTKGAGYPVTPEELNSRYPNEFKDPDQTEVVDP